MQQPYGQVTGTLRPPNESRCRRPGTLSNALPPPQLTRAILPASSSSVSLRSALMLFTISWTKLQFSP